MKKYILHYLNSIDYYYITTYDYTLGKGIDTIHDIPKLINRLAPGGVPWKKHLSKQCSNYNKYFFNTYEDLLHFYPEIFI